ncbi:MAG TPA: hypothetical protein VI198_00240 [Candidatus Eisenbacteria bacterium]
MTSRLAAPLAAAAVLLLLSTPSWAGKKEPRGRTWTFDFRADTLGMAPSGATVMGGTWVVLADSTAGAAAGAGAGADSATSPPRVLRQSANDEARAANWIRLAKPTIETGEISVRFRILSGEIDPSIGVAFHLDAKGKNGYLVRLSGADDEIVAHYLLSGKRRDIKMQRLKNPPAGEWHTLGVRRERERIVVFYDGVETMALRDERFIRGTVGLWTEDDTVAEFADLKITAR